jgi:hypothetical protein
MKRIVLPFHSSSSPFGLIEQRVAYARDSGTAGVWLAHLRINGSSRGNNFILSDEAGPWVDRATD